MEDLNYDKLINIIKTSTKKSYRVYIDDKGKPVPNVANLGATKGDIAKLERHGEYYGIAVEFLENAMPLLTDAMVIRLCTMLKKEDFVTPLTILKLTSLNELQYILDKWFRVATTEYDNSIHISKQTKHYTKFDEWIDTVTHDPIINRIKIVEIGQNQNTGDSVVPPDWLEREFSNGRELHAAMDQTETRVGKPPVTYAIIHSMIIQKHDTLITDLTNITYDRVFYVEWLGSQTKITIKSAGAKPKPATKSKPWSYVKHGPNIVAFHLPDILVPKNSRAESQVQLREVGLLVSRLQKAIRRGRFASRIMTETVNALNVSPNYNLPEHGFLRVSSAKQLVWRLFISILEDCRPYQEVDELSLLDLIILVLITQKCQEYQFTPSVLKAIRQTAILAQANDTPDDLFPWRELHEASRTPVVPDSPYHTALSLALSSVIMMQGDAVMLRKLYTYKDALEPFVIPNKFKHKDDVYEDVFLSSIDPHSNTYIILYYQACHKIGKSTREISNYIWDTSSSYNVRSTNPRPKLDPLLRRIQAFFAYGEHRGTVETPSATRIMINPKIQHVIPNTQAARTSFLLLFGTKYAVKIGSIRREVIVAGTPERPLQIKIDNEWRTDVVPELVVGKKPSKEFITVANAYPMRTIYLNTIDPPIGYKWTKNKIITFIQDGVPHIDTEPIPYFDGSSILESIIPVIDTPVDTDVYRLIITVLSGQQISFDTMMNQRKKHLNEIMNWYPRAEDMKQINMELVQLAYTKIFNQFNNIITIGPVDRMGNKMHNSIHYLLEGKLWAVFNLFTYLYPSTFRINGALNFHIKKKTPGYVHLIDTLESILFVRTKIPDTSTWTESPKTNRGHIMLMPEITTNLWDHQIESSNKILAGFARNQHGFGDASDVGAGKTLTSLNIAVELIKRNKHTFSGILVMLPGNKLIPTWLTEIDKHTRGFHIITQANKADVGQIRRNTIVVTTMARIRDHPINHTWLLVIIDECLTVQNKNALWTEAAWKQSLMSKHLVMMSATFFRTRFDKLYYMLKMLQSGLPEAREYLDTILLETIVSHMSSIKRKWTSNINRFKLDAASREQYESIEKINADTEALYSKLTSFLISDSKVNRLVVKQLQKLINQLEKKGQRCLIYARAKEEAEYWSEQLDIPIYPTKGNHVIVTYNDGTYGLNDLVIYDTIVMRPPQPDKLTQIKGRLDRPGQKSDDLSIEYFILADTVEEGLLIRMHIASQFVHQYIMPLAKFYDVSVHYKKFVSDE